MVRVGGGWDTLEHYLIRHDPCRKGDANSRSPTPDIIRQKLSVPDCSSSLLLGGSTPCLTNQVNTMVKEIVRAVNM